MQDESLLEEDNGIHRSLENLLDVARSMVRAKIPSEEVCNQLHEALRLFADQMPFTVTPFYLLIGGPLEDPLLSQRIEDQKLSQMTKNYCRNIKLTHVGDLRCIEFDDIYSRFDFTQEARICRELNCFKKRYGLMVLDLFEPLRWIPQMASDHRVFALLNLPLAKAYENHLQHKRSLLSYHESGIHYVGEALHVEEVQLFLATRGVPSWLLDRVYFPAWSAPKEIPAYIAEFEEEDRLKKEDMARVKLLRQKKLLQSKRLEDLGIQEAICDVLRQNGVVSIRHLLLQTERVFRSIIQSKWAGDIFINLSIDNIEKEGFSLGMTAEEIEAILASE